MLKTKSKIEEALQLIVGTTLEGLSRAYKIQRFHFDSLPFVLEKGTIEYLGKYILSIDCSWRLLCFNRLLVGSSDVYKEAEDSDDIRYDADIPKYNRRDEKLEEIVLSSIELKVTGVSASDIGDVQIFFTNGYVIEIFPNQTELEDYESYWKLISTSPHEEVFSFKEVA